MIVNPIRAVVLLAVFLYASSVGVAVCLGQVRASVAAVKPVTVLSCWWQEECSWRPGPAVPATTKVSDFRVGVVDGVATVEDPSSLTAVGVSGSTAATSILPLTIQLISGEGEGCESCSLIPLVSRGDSGCPDCRLQLQLQNYSDHFGTIFLASYTAELIPQSDYMVANNPALQTLSSVSEPTGMTVLDLQGVFPITSSPCIYVRFTQGQAPHVPLEQPLVCEVETGACCFEGTEGCAPTCL